MDYTLQLHGEKRVYPVPDGLYELMSDIAREVLRSQPTNMIIFIAEYLTALINTREATKAAVDMVSVVFEKGKTYIDFLENLGISKDEATRAATIIQATYRGYCVRKSLGNGLLPCEEFAEPTEDLDMYSFLNERNLTFLQANDAATKIQKTYRGYCSRKKYSLKQKALAWVRSHESWRDDWLWQEFGMTTEDFKLSLERKSTFRRSEREETRLPFRSVTLDRMKLHTLFDEQVMTFESDSLPAIPTPDMEEKYIMKERLDSAVESESGEVEEREGMEEDMEEEVEEESPGALEGPIQGELEGEWDREQGGEGLEDEFSGEMTPGEYSPGMEGVEEEPYTSDEEGDEQLWEAEETAEEFEGEASDEAETEQWQEEEVPAEEGLAEESPVEEPAEGVPTEEGFGEEVPEEEELEVEEGLEEELPEDEFSEEETPIEEVGREEMPAEEGSAAEPPAEQ